MNRHALGQDRGGRFRPQHNLAPHTAAALASLCLVAACAPQPSAPVSAATSGSSWAPEGALDILAPPGYIERGETDPAYDWVTGFEAATGCRVTVTLSGSSAETRSRAQQALQPAEGATPIDLIIASSDVTGLLVRAGLAAPLDATRIPSLGAIDQRLRKAARLDDDGKLYGVPLQWGPNVLLYDQEVFKAPPASWDVVFAEQKLPDGRSNRGRVQAHAEPIYMADVALYLRHRRPELGIQDPYALSEAQYAAVLELLRAQRPLVQRYWLDANLQISDVLNEGIKATSSRYFQVSTLLANKSPVAVTLPREGATGWLDSALLVKGAAHPHCAHRWLEWSLSKKVQGDMAAWLASNPVVLQACEGNELLRDGGCRAQGVETLEQLAFWRTPEARCGGETACVPYERWVEDYSALKAGTPTTGK